MALILMLVLGVVGFFSVLAGAVGIFIGNGMNAFFILAVGLLLLTAAFFVDRTRFSKNEA
jgi:hypothetical protein